MSSGERRAASAPGQRTAEGMGTELSQQKSYCPLQK